jgi:iron complex outermembrane receptor protein
MRQSVLFAAAFLLCAGLSQTAFAQAEDDSVRYMLDPVTITGMKMDHSWIQMPLSLTVVGTTELSTPKGYGLNEVLSFVPGVLAQSRYGNHDVRLVIRGFGARGAGERSNSGTTRGIRILSDGIPETEPDGRTSLDLIDISGAGSIEVLRSNASSLYGNAAGGIVNITSNSSFADPFASFRSSFGSFGFHKEYLSGGAFLGDGTGRMYYSLGNTTFDGWRAHSRSSQALLSTGVVTPVGESTDLGVHLSATSNVFRIPGALTQAQYDLDPSMSDSIYIARDERRNNRLGRLGVTLEHRLDESNVVSATAYAQPKYLSRSERNTYRDFTRYHVGGSAMYRNTAALGADGKNTFLAGIDEAYQDGAILFYTLVNGGRALPLRDNKREGANNIGGFVQDEVMLGDSWIFLVGARYDNVAYNYESYVDLNLHDKKEFTRVTPKAGITYRISPMHSIYASLGGGLEVPAGNETDPAGTFGQDTVYAINPLLEPMKSTTVEVGTKQVVGLGGGEKPAAYLTYDVAAYWLRVTDDIIPYRGGRFYFTAGSTERMGVEAGGELNFTMGLSANVSLTVSNNEYKQYLVDSVHYDPAKAGVYADYSGNKVVGVPDVFWSFGLRYAPGGLGGLYVGGIAQSTGEYFVDDANLITVPSSTVFGANVGIDHWTPGGGNFFLSASAGVNNVSDLKYIGSAWLNPDYVNGQPVYIESGLPRNFVGSVSVGMTL